MLFLKSEMLGDVFKKQTKNHTQETPNKQESPPSPAAVIPKET